MNRNELGRVVGLGLTLAAGLALAQSAPVPAAPPLAPGAQSIPVPGAIQQGGGGSSVTGTGSTVPGSAPGQSTAGADAPMAGQGPSGALVPGVPSSVEKQGASEPLTLEMLVERARRMDARVAEADAELRRLKALQRQADWAWFPKFETLVGVGGPVPEARNNGLGGPPTTEASLEGDLNFGRVGITAFVEANAVLPLYTFGKLTALKEAAAKGPIIGNALRERARDEAGFQAAQAFYGYQLARAGLEQLEDVAKRLDEAAERINALLEEESPQVSKLDTYKVNYFRQLVAAQRAEALQGRALALQAIRLLSGAGPEEQVEVVALDLPLEEEVKVATLDDALALAKRCRPEFEAIRAGIEAREKEVFIRERSYYPDIGLAGFVTYRYTSSATVQLSPFAFDPYNERSGGVGLVTRATFDIPVKNAVLEQSRAELAKLQAQSVLLEAAIRLEVTKVHGELAAALSRAQSFREAEKNARRWATAAYAAFDLGTGDTRELVDAFTALAQASAGASKSWHDVRVGLAALSRVTGTPVKRCE